jgi:hypothetical protein
MGTAVCFAMGMSGYALTNFKELRIAPSRKHQVIQDWGYETQDKAIQSITVNPIAFHAQSFKDIRQEGLGINHDEWVKMKQQSK